MCAHLSSTDVIRALGNHIDSRWKHFGTFLHIQPTLMDAIGNDSTHSADYMLDLVSKWVTYQEGSGDLPRTWQTVVEAVRDSGFGQLALDLAKRYEVTLT